MLPLNAWLLLIVLFSKDRLWVDFKIESILFLWSHQQAKKEIGEIGAAAVYSCLSKTQNLMGGNAIIRI